MITKIKKNKLLVYSFFQLFILMSARSGIGPLIPLIDDELNVGFYFIGSAISLSIFGLIIGSLTASNLIGFIGLKKVMIGGLAISLLGSLGLYISHTFPIFILAYFLLLLSIGVVTSCVLSIVGNFYSKNKVASLIKVNLGYIFAFIITPLLVSLMLFLKLNWHYFFIFILIPQVILLIILPLFKIPIKIRMRGNLKTIFTINKKVVSNPNFILYGLIVFFYVPTFNIFFTWFTLYFKNIDIDISMSSIFLSIFGVSLFFGMLIKNTLIKFFQVKRIMFYSFIVSLGMLVGVLLIDNLILKIIFIFLFGCSISGNFELIFSISVNLFPKYANSVSGLLVTFANLGVMAFIYLSGYLSEYYSKNSVLYINISALLILIILIAIINFNKRLSRV